MTKKSFTASCLLSLLGLVVVSCGSDGEAGTYKVISTNAVTEHSATLIELKGENVGPLGEFGQLKNISMVGATIVVQDTKSGHAFLGLKDDLGLFSFQAVGDGPGKIDDANLIKIVNNDEASDEMYFFNFLTKSVNSIKVQPGASYQAVGKIPESYGRELQSAVNINDSLVAVTGNFAETKFAIFNRNSQKEVLRSEYINSFAAELTEEERVQISPTDIKHNNKHQLIIVNNASLNSIDIFSETGQLHKFYSFGAFKNLSEEKKLSRDYFYYYDVKTKEDVVYCLYMGVEHSEIAIKDLFFFSARPELHVYNLLTDELQRYKLDRLINACVLDLKNNAVYCIEENNEDQPLVKYEIPEIQ
jgi:hypothetical protein